jgi:hypothetical protein
VYLVFKPRAIYNTRAEQARGRWSRPSDLIPNITGEGVTEDLQFEITGSYRKWGLHGLKHSNGWYKGMMLTHREGHWLSTTLVMSLDALDSAMFPPNARKVRGT